jgi:beta-lactamase regulating signal transducer with metallopeptidase domain
MLAWMVYGTLVGALLCGAAALLEKNSPWLSGSRRFLWLVTLAGALSFLAAAESRLPVRPATAMASGTAAARVTALAVRAALPESGSFAAHQTTPVTAAWSIGDLDGILIFAWVIASAMCVAMLGVSLWRLSRMRRGWREAVIAGVPVLVSHDVGPAVIGLIHHGIVVPEWVETLDADAQRAVMTHEREHVRAGDPLLLWAATLLVALAPWNGALWYVLRRLRHAIEMDCDARVLQSRPDTHAYCRLLLDVGERTMAGVAPMAALAEPSTMLERRISAMTAHASVPRRIVAAGALASLVLVAAAFATPRPPVTPAGKLAALLASRSGIPGTMSVRATGQRDVADASDGRPMPDWHAALRTLYRQLRERTDTTAMMVVLTYDSSRRLRGSSVQAMPAWPNFQAPDFSNVQIQTFGMYPAPGLHTTVVPVVEKWDINAEPAVSAYGGRRTTAESRNVPPSRQFLWRLDSLAHANVPQSYTPSGDPQIVTVLFDADARVARWFTRPTTSAESVSVTIASHGPAEMLASVLPAPLPTFASYGAYTFRDAPRTIFLYAELAPAPGRVRLPESRAIILVKPIMTMETGLSGTTSQLAPAERNRTVLVYTTGDAAMSIGGEAPRPRRDTLHLTLPGAVSLELSRPGDVHFVSVDGRPFDLAGMLIGGGAQELSGHGRHMMILSGGAGIQVVK